MFSRRSLLSSPLLFSSLTLSQSVKSVRPSLLDRAERFRGWVHFLLSPSVPPSLPLSLSPSAPVLCLIFNLARALSPLTFFHFFRFAHLSPSSLPPLLSLSLSSCVACIKTSSRERERERNQFLRSFHDPTDSEDCRACARVWSPPLESESIFRFHSISECEYPYCDRRTNGRRSPCCHAGTAGMY